MIKIPTILLGQEYKIDARGKDGKYDCLGIIFAYFKIVKNIHIKEIKDIGKDGLLPKAIFSQFEKIDALEDEAFVIFDTPPYGFHAGLYIGHGKMFHCPTERRSCIESIKMLGLKYKIKSLWRLKNGIKNSTKQEKSKEV